MTEDEKKETKPKRTRKATTKKGTVKPRASKKEAAPEIVEEAAEVEKQVKAEKVKKPRAKRATRKTARKAKVAEPSPVEPPARPAEAVAPVPPEPVPPVAQPVAPPPVVKLKYGKGTSAYAHMNAFRKRAYRQSLGRTEWERLIKWRKEGTITPVDHPTRLDRARALGYKAKQGVTLVRIKVRRGGLRKRKISKGRRARRKGILRITMNKSIQRIAEERVQKHYPNMEVLNSYDVGQDGMHKWFEVILVDPYSPSVLSDKNLNWISDPAHSNRVYRGLTSAGRAGRGLRWRGKGAEKVRPSIRAHDRKGK